MTTLIKIAPWRNHAISKYYEYLEANFLQGLDYVIAGGSTRSLYVRDHLGKSDIDVWFLNDTDLQKAKKRFEQQQHPNEYYNENVSWSKPTSDSFMLMSTTIHGHTFSNFNSKHAVLPHMIQIQLLARKAVEPSMAGVLAMFDMTICQFGYKNGMIYATPEAISDHKSKILRMTGNNAASVNYDRVIKYIEKGYTPNKDLFDRMFLQPTHTMTPGSIELPDLDYDDFFKRVI